MWGSTKVLVFKPLKSTKGNYFMGVNLLLIASESDNQAIYLDLLNQLEASIEAIPAFDELDESLTNRYFNGLLVDFNTRFKAIKKNREFVYRIMEKFPVAILRLDREERNIKAFYRGFSQRISLEAFVAEKCRPFKPRRFRYHVRKRLHFNVRLSKSASLDDAASSEKSFTMDVSRGGCFVFSVQAWRRDDPVWMVAEELKDTAPLQGIVRHATPWGTELKVPGIGIEIKTINADQEDQLVKEFGL